MKIEITAECESSVKMVRPETGTFTLRITSTAAFHALPSDEQAEWAKALNEAKNFHYGKDGALTFVADGLAAYFTIEKVSEAWAYNGGECHILHTSYETWARRK